MNQAPEASRALAVVTNVQSKLVNKKDGTSFTMYTISTTLGEMTTSRKEIAESAWSLVNQSAELTYVVQQNGQYTNTYLNQVLPAPPNAALQAQIAQGPALLQPTAPLPVAGLTAAPAAIPSSDETTRTSIHRQCATKVAATLGAADFWVNVGTLVRFYETGVAPEGSVVAQLAGMAAEAPYSDLDIPFQPTI